MIFSDRDPIEKIDHQAQYILLDHMIKDPLSVDLNEKFSLIDHLDEDQDVQRRRSSSSHLDPQQQPKAVLHSLETLIRNAQASHKNIPRNMDTLGCCPFSLW